MRQSTYKRNHGARAYVATRRISGPMIVLAFVSVLFMVATIVFASTN